MSSFKLVDGTMDTIKTYCERIALSWMIFLYIAISTPLAVIVSTGYQNRFITPFIILAAIYPVFYYSVRSSPRIRTFLVMVFWAVILAVSVSTVTYNWPIEAGSTFIRGISYQNEMFAWINTGVGTEGSPSKFIPLHAGHLIAFTAATLLTGGLLGLLFGIILVSYMSFYVGILVFMAMEPNIALCFSWPPYSVIRVLSYLLLGVVLAEPGIRKVSASLKLDTMYSECEPAQTRSLLHEGRHRTPSGCWAERGSFNKFVIIGLSGAVLDIVLKALIAEHWREVLVKALTEI